MKLEGEVREGVAADPKAPIEVELVVNGQRRSIVVRPWRLLVDVLREELGLTGTKAGCRHGVCGSCTVLIDGIPTKSCLMLAVQADGCHILTIEGISSDGKLHPLQESFVSEGAVQCGFCTPGLIMSAYWLLGSNPDPTDDEVKEVIAGNICRCTGYVKVLRAIQKAAQRLRSEGARL